MTTKPIAKRDRIVRWLNGYPVVRIAGEDRVVQNIVNKGTDNPKTAKNNADDFLAVATSLSPHKSAGIGNVCPHAGGCAQTCLDSTGKGASKGDMYKMIHAARIAKTIIWYKARDWFLEQQSSDLAKWEAKASAQGKKLCYRGNMLSDIAWEQHGVPQAHPNVMMYDYGKDPSRIGWILPNYYVTFSRDSHKDDATCIELLKAGKNVAICFDDGYTSGARNLHGGGPRKMPVEWNGFPVFSGDTTDRRWEDPSGHVIGLILKAPSLEFRMKALESGFAI